jgi:hypothetical protein
MPKGTRKAGPLPAAKQSAINRKNSANSPWRKMVVSPRSIECQEYFAKLAKDGDTKRKPRPELD